MSFNEPSDQHVKEAAEKKELPKAATEFRDLCLLAVKKLGKKSIVTNNWRLFRESLIISYFPNRGSGQYLGCLGVIQGKTIIWDGIDDKPVADFSDVAKIVKGWLKAKTFDKLMEKRFTPEQQQNIKEAAEKKINAIKNEKAKK